MSYSHFRGLGLACLVIAVAACGGGGGGGSDPTPVPVPPGSQVNLAPVVNAGPDQTVDEGTVVQLAGTAVDSDGSILSIAWTQMAGPIANLSNATGLLPSFTAPQVDENTELEFQLTAVDDDGASASDRVRIIVQDVPVSPPGNSAPQALSASERIDEGKQLSGQLTGSDPDGDSLTFAVVTSPAHGQLVVQPSTGLFQYTPNPGPPGADSFSFQVSDGSLTSNIATISIAITQQSAI